MKCPSCGAEARGKFCEYCGSEMPKENVTINITNNYYGGAEKQQSSKVQNAPQSQVQKTTKNKGKISKRTWLWILGWIFIFPVPLTILLLRNKKMNPKVKYGIIAAVWLLVFIVGITGNNETEVQQNDVPAHTESAEIVDEPIETNTTDNEGNTSPYPVQIISTDYTGPECWLINEPIASGSETVLMSMPLLTLLQLIGMNRLKLFFRSFGVSMVKIKYISKFTMEQRGLKRLSLHMRN